jgi:hypothetical protein
MIMEILFTTIWGIAALSIISIALIALRRWRHPNAIKKLNLFFAVGLFLLMAFALILPPRTPQPPGHVWSIYAIIDSFIILVWLAGAIGLFFRKRLAWCTSILGVGTMVCLLVGGLISIIKDISHPGADIPHTGSFRDGFIFASVFASTWITLWLTASLALLLGLVKMFKDIFGAKPPRLN